MSSVTSIFIGQKRLRKQVLFKVMVLFPPFANACFGMTLSIFLDNWKNGFRSSWSVIHELACQEEIHVMLRKNQIFFKKVKSTDFERRKVQFAPEISVFTLSGPQKVEKFSILQDFLNILCRLDLGSLKMLQTWAEGWSTRSWEAMVTNDLRSKCHKCNIREKFISKVQKKNKKCHQRKHPQWGCLPWA